MAAEKKPAKRNRRRVSADGSPRRLRTDDENAVIKRAKLELLEQLTAKGYKVVRAKDAQKEDRQVRSRTLARRGQKRCKGFNLVGDPCQQRALRPGLEIEGEIVSGDFCLKCEDGIGPSTWRRFRQDGDDVEPLPKRVSPMELAAAAFERAPHYLMRPYLDTLGLEMDIATGELSRKPGGGAKVVGFSREGVARVSKYENLELQVRTAEKFADRFYGKPRSAVSLDGVAGGAIVINMPNDPEHYNSVARVLIETGAVPRENGNGHVDKTDQNTIESTGEEVLEE